MKYRKKPVVIDAIRWADSPSVLIEIQKLADGKTISVDYKKKPVLRIPTLEGMMEAKIGDWIIKGVNGEIYPCKPDIFEKTYEKVSGK